METPKPMLGAWTLKAPDGRTWQADTPLRCCADEQRARVPADVALARIMEANKPSPEEEADEALLQTALEALEYHRDQTRPIDRTTAAIAALRDRLRHNVVRNRRPMNGAALRRDDLGRPR